jgi:3-oxoacyl-[acyl-carrier protein] reductase
LYFEAALVKSNAFVTVDLGLKERTAFVAGASSGLGYAVAEALLQEGCRVAMCSRSASRIESAAASLEHRGTVIPLVCDVTDEDQIQQAFEAASDAFDGRLNVLVTNSGGPPAGFVDDFDAAQWREGLELNLVSTINLCRHALPSLRAAAREPDRHARIIMVSSVSAKQPVPNLYLSNTARAGVQGFCKSLSEELGPESITVNTVLPGYTETERLKDLARSTMERTGKSIDQIYSEWAAGTAVRRLASPSEFAAAVTFLAGRQAAYITGIALPVEGGSVKALM